MQWAEGCATSRRTGIVTGETSLLMYGRGERFDGTSPGVLYFHGLGQTDVEPLIHYIQGATYVPQLVNRGFIVASSLWGSSTNHGDAASVTAAEQARTWLIANGAKDGPLGAWGVSMGFMTLASWWDANPTHIGAALGVVPTCNYEHTWDDSGAPGDPDPAIVARSPHLILADRADTIPGQLVYSSEDVAIRPADVLDLADVLGFTATDTEPTSPSGHDSFKSPGYDQFGIIDLFQVLR